MTYCVTPGCLSPHNPDTARYCLSCGCKLWLKERYRSIQPIGSGGFGRTFLAVDEDIPSKPQCVIKQLYLHNPGILVAKKATELFQQEAVRLDELGKHSQIPTLWAHFEQNRQLYLVQESTDAVLQSLKLMPKTNYTSRRGINGQSLVSEIGIDYTPLQNLLSRNKWQEADQQTWTLLCQALGKRLGYYLTSGDIEKLSCEDLWIIDQLWVKYSNKRFGLSIQKYIYEDVGKDYPSFCDRVGWPLHNPPDLDSPLKFNRSAPMGHLPSRRWIGGYSWWNHATVLAKKLEECGIT